MKTLDRYIGANIVRGYLLVLALLLALFSFVSLLEQLEDVGDHNYDMLDAILYVLLTMPDRMLTLAPVTALLGSLAALALLARNNELTAMKAAGISVLRLGWSVMRPAIAFMLVVLVVTEFVAPRCISLLPSTVSRKLPNLTARCCVAKVSGPGRSIRWSTSGV